MLSAVRASAVMSAHLLVSARVRLVPMLGRGGSAGRVGMSDLWVWEAGTVNDFTGLCEKTL